MTTLVVLVALAALVLTRAAWLAAGDCASELGHTKVKLRHARSQLLAARAQYALMREQRNECFRHAQHLEAQLAIANAALKEMAAERDKAQERWEQAWTLMDATLWPEGVE